MKKDKKIDCKKHGEGSAVNFKEGKFSIRVCFKCFAEKATKGLKKY